MIDHGTNVQHSSKTNEHYTPSEVIVAATYTLEAIDLDPASHARVAGHVGAAAYYSERDDGLTQPWPGRVFLNPPGGRGNAKKWWAKLIYEYARNTTSAIFIGFSLEIMQTAQSFTLSPLDFPFCVPSKRLQFLDKDLQPERSPTHANDIVFLPDGSRRRGDQIERFFYAFRGFGLCVEPRTYRYRG